MTRMAFHAKENDRRERTPARSADQGLFSVGSLSQMPGRDTRPGRSRIRRHPPSFATIYLLHAETLDHLVATGIWSSVMLGLMRYHAVLSEIPLYAFCTTLPARELACRPRSCRPTMRQELWTNGSEAPAE